MNDLRLLLENIHRTLELRTALEQYRAEKYEGLTQPWIVSQATKQISPTPGPDPSSTEDQKFKKELENVDNLLQKAKLIREKGDGKSLKPSGAAASKAGPDHCQQCVKGICTRHKSATGQSSASGLMPSGRTKGKVQKTVKPKSGLASQRQLPNFSGRVRSAKARDARTGSKAQAKVQTGTNYKPNMTVETNPVAKTSENETGADKEGQENLMVTKSLCEVVQENGLKLSKFRKLQSMHAKLKSQSSGVISTPCSEEMDFISKLYGSKYPVLVVCNDAAFRELKVITHKVHNLEQVLSQKDSITKHHDKGSKLYLERKLYRNASDIFETLTSKFQSLNDATVTCLKPKRIVNHVDETKVLPSPFEVSFRHEHEPVALCKAKYDLMWNSLLVTIKEEIYETLTQILDNTPAYLDSDKVGIGNVNPDYSTIVKHAFGLLAQSHRHSIPPAIVWDE